ncbi:MAG: DUF3524 domain-containing protein [Acidimicrobiia bacterium]
MNVLLLVTHFGSWWKWRMRGSALTLATFDGWPPGLVLVSDMTDLAQFRTFARPFLGDPPTLLYFHETQLTYPTSPTAQPDLSYGLTNWVSACSADLVLFNSDCHREIFFQELPRLLRSFPDQTHEHLIDEVAGRSEVLPVGVDLFWIEPKTGPNSPPRILWNHRWDHDKDPDAFADAVEQLVAAGAEFELVLLGPRPPHPPTALTRIRAAAGDRILADGEAPGDLYRELVASSDVVVSTALQEFFGISVVEAIAAGCRPVLPNRLSYPGLIPVDHHGTVLYPEGGLVEALTTALNEPLPPPGLQRAMARFSWDEMAPVYDQRLQQIAIDTGALP